MPESSSKKRPPPGLESAPRSDRKHADNVALLNYVREELERQQRAQGELDREKLAAGLTMITPAGKERLDAWFRTGPQSPRPRPDPLKLAIVAAESKRNGAPLLAYLNEQLSGTGIKVRVIMPKLPRGHYRSRLKRGVPDAAVEMARDVLKILRRHFTPNQRESWWSVGLMATILWYESDDPPFAKAMTEDPAKFKDPTTYSDWEGMIERRIRRGDEKRTSRERSLPPAIKMPG